MQDPINFQGLKDLESHGVSRRQLLRGFAVGGAALGVGGLLAACGGSSGSGGSGGGSGSKQVVYSSWGGTWAATLKKAWFDPFEKATGIKVVVVGPPDYGTIEAMVTANNTTWDIAEVGPDFQYIGAQKKVLTPIDWNVVQQSNFATGNPEFHTNYSVPQSQWAAVITWRTDKFKQGPQTWADVFDTRKFPGRRAMDNSAIDDGSLEAALLADGVPKDKLYPLDVDRALAKLDTIKSDLLWYTSGAQMIQYFQSGQTPIGLGWDGRIDVLKKSGTPVESTYNQALNQWVVMVVPKGAPNSANAMKLLNFATEAKPQAAMSMGSYYGPINPKAFSYIPKSAQSGLSGTGQDLKDGVNIDWKWWTANYDAVNAKFTSWLNS